MYNYREELTNDIKEAIKNNAEIDLNDLLYNRCELAEKLQEELWIDDSVTGNASGSYTCNAYEAEENLVGNWELLHEAVREFGCDNVDILDKGAEWCDVTIRCYLLGECIESALDELEEEATEE